jgi:hypothetical protein
MSDSDRVAHLIGLGRRLIADEMKRSELLGGAFDGSLATGRAWATSDLDFTIFPPASSAPSDPRSVPAYRFYYAQGPLARHHQFVDLRVVEGTFVNMHIKTKEALDQLVADFPSSFIESAEWIPADAEPTHFLDGLAIMSIVADRHGYLAAIKEFVAQHRFSPVVLRERLARMCGWVERRLGEARRVGAPGELDLAGGYDVARCIAQMWLEKHARIYSKKEQDSLLAEVVLEVKAPRIHELYRSVLGLDMPEAALQAVLRPIAEYAERVDLLFGFVEKMAADRVEELGVDVVERCRAFRIWAALTLKSIPIAFEKGCYAHMAFALQGVGPTSLNKFVLLLERIAPSQATSIKEVCHAEIARSRAVWDLFGYTDSEESGRPQHRFDAASQLLDLTRRKLMA